MGLKFSDLYAAPEVNPVNRKARAVPFFNPINVYGRVFFFSWFGFMIAFWAWYTFPPLVCHSDSLISLRIPRELTY
jgi:NNP family nitrate/nitrite transporter-like MFS transporter